MKITILKNMCYRSEIAMKTIPGLRDTVVQMDKIRTQLGREVGTVRVDVKNMEQLRHEGRVEGFTLVVDEPRERGGTGTAPSPLNYFLFGAASCFLNQLVRAAIISDLKIETMEITARAHFDRAKTRKFIDLTYDVMLTGSESKENSADLLHKAEEMCYVHQTLKDVIPLTSNLFLNGAQVASNTLRPRS